jgi:hypothetical protein
LKVEKVRRGLIILICGLGVLGVFLVLFKLRLPFNTLLWREVHNTGHTPLFAIMALSILGLLSRSRGMRPKPIIYRYLQAFVITLALGAGLEIYQIWGPGDPDIMDFTRDVAGAFPALAVAMYFDKDLYWKRNPGNRKWRYFLLAGAVIIWLSAFVPVGLWGAAYLEREALFPNILNFESTLDMKFAKTRNARLKIVEPPAGWRLNSDKVGKLTFLDGDYPGLAIREPHPDWSGYRFLKIDLFSMEPDSVRLVIRIDDSHHNGAFHDRFNRAIFVGPGANEIMIPLEDIRNGPTGRETDMTAIKNVILFSSRRKKESSLYIGNLRLE